MVLTPKSVLHIACITFSCTLQKTFVRVGLQKFCLHVYWAVLVFPKSEIEYAVIKTLTCTYYWQWSMKYWRENEEGFGPCTSNSNSSCNSHSRSSRSLLVIDVPTVETSINLLLALPLNPRTQVLAVTRSLANFTYRSAKMKLLPCT